MTKSEGQVCMGQYLCCIGTGFSSGPDPNIWSGGRGQGPKLSNPARATLTNPVWPNSRPIGDSAGLPHIWIFLWILWILDFLHPPPWKRNTWTERKRNGPNCNFVLPLPCDWTGFSRHNHYGCHICMYQVHVGMTILPATKWGNLFLEHFGISSVKTRGQHQHQQQTIIVILAPGSKRLLLPERLVQDPPDDGGEEEKRTSMEKNTKQNKSLWRLYPLWEIITRSKKNMRVWDCAEPSGVVQWDQFSSTMNMTTSMLIGRGKIQGGAYHKRHF